MCLSCFFVCDLSRNSEDRFPGVTVTNGHHILGNEYGKQRPIWGKNKFRYLVFVTCVIFLGLKTQLITSTCSYCNMRLKLVADYISLQSWHSKIFKWRNSDTHKMGKNCLHLYTWTHSNRRLLFARHSDAWCMASGQVLTWEQYMIRTLCGVWLRT